MLATAARNTEVTPPSGPRGVNLNVTVICPECRQDPPDIIERFADGDMVCANCGLVLGDRIVDTRSEWRTFSNDDQGGDDPSRVGDAGNPLLDSSQLDTIIASGAPGSNLGRELQRLQSRSSHDKKDTTLNAAYSKITQMCEAFQLTRVVQDASKDVFRVVHDNKMLKGRSQESIIAASIFIACRISNVPRAFKEICALTRVPKREIGRTFKIMEQILINSGVRLNQTQQNSDYATGQTSAEDLIRRFCSQLGLSLQVTKAAEHIARRVKEEGTLDGRSPISIAAAAIYMAAALFGAGYSAARIAEKTGGATDGTIKTSYRFLWEARDKLIDTDWLRPGGGADMERLPRVDRR